MHLFAVYLVYYTLIYVPENVLESVKEVIINYMFEYRKHSLCDLSEIDITTLHQLFSKGIM